jgi:hypothetical protein
LLRAAFRRISAHKSIPRHLHANYRGYSARKSISGYLRADFRGLSAQVQAYPTRYPGKRNNLRAFPAVITKIAVTCGQSVFDSAIAEGGY